MDELAPPLATVREAVTAELKADWARLSGDPTSVADLVIKTLVPLLMPEADRADPIRGAPWGMGR